MKLETQRSDPLLERSVHSLSAISALGGSNQLENTEFGNVRSANVQASWYRVKDPPLSIGFKSDLHMDDLAEKGLFALGENFDRRLPGKLTYR